GVSAAPPPWLPPICFRTSGSRKQRFILSISSHARRYDMSMARPAAAMDPCSSISSSSRILPGPIAPSPLKSTRRVSLAMPPPGKSAARHAHMSADRGSGVPAIDDEVVALGLAADRFVDGRLQQLVAFARPQRRAQVGGVILAETHVQRARAGEPHAV